MLNQRKQTFLGLGSGFYQNKSVVKMITLVPVTREGHESCYSTSCEQCDILILFQLNEYSSNGINLVKILLIKARSVKQAR